MSADLIVLIILGATTLALVLSKTHVAFVTLALCSGFVLSAEIGPGFVDLVTRSTEKVENLPAYTVITLILLLLPAVLVAWHFKKTQKGSSRLIGQIIPALALALLLSVFIFDFLPEVAKAYVSEETYIYGQLNILRSIIVLFAVLTALFDIMRQHTD